MENGLEKRLFRVGSRTSKLALDQTEIIIDLLKKENKNVDFKIVTMDTLGDKLLNTKLSNIKESSLFTKELELALLMNEVDFVVHSMKDVPTLISKRFVIGCVTARGSCNDVVIMKLGSQYQTLSSLPHGSIIGTSSVRRTAQLKKKYPHLKFKSIRGNLNTRLLKLDDSIRAMEMGKGDGQSYDAIILAKAGLERLEWKHRISEELLYDDTLYAVGQGALACECRNNDEETKELLASIHDHVSGLTCIAERSVMSELEGGCSTALSVRSSIKNGRLTLRGCLMNPEGTEAITSEVDTELIMEPIESRSNSIQNGHKNKPMTNGNNYLTFTGIEVSNIDSETGNQMMTCYKAGVLLAKNILEKGGEKILKENKINQMRSNRNVIQM